MGLDDVVIEVNLDIYGCSCGKYGLCPGEDASTERNDQECAMSSPVQVSYDGSY
jgi:hypothetical protein